MNKLSIQHQLTQFFIASGMPKSMVSVLVFLLICEPSRQTATTIELTTSLSKGSVNNALQSLIQSGLVTVSKNDNERNYYYELDSLGWQRAIDQRLRALVEATTIAKDGLKEFPDNTRLQSMYDAYQSFSEQYNKFHL